MDKQSGCMSCTIPRPEGFANILGLRIYWSSWSCALLIGILHVITFHEEITLRFLVVINFYFRSKNKTMHVSQKRQSVFYGLYHDKDVFAMQAWRLPRIHDPNALFKVAPWECFLNEVLNSCVKQCLNDTKIGSIWSLLQVKVCQFFHVSRWIWPIVNVG